MNITYALAKIVDHHLNLWKERFLKMNKLI